MKLYITDTENEQKLRDEIDLVYKEYGDEDALYEEIAAFFDKYHVPEDEAEDFVVNKAFRFLILAFTKEIEANLNSSDDKKEDA